MTDYSKIDFTQLKLEQIDGLLPMRATQVEDEIEITIGGLVVARKRNNEWILTASVNGCNRAKIDELWKRTEQVDEFIRQQSRRRITVLELAKELINSGKEIRVQHLTNSDIVYKYRFNGTTCNFEVSDGSQFIATSLGCGKNVVTILD